LNRGDIYDVVLPGGGRPAVIVTRDVAIPLLRNVCVAAVTSRARGIRTEVPVGPAQGLRRECVVSCDNLFTMPKAALGERRGSIGADLRPRLDDALRVALDLD